MKRILIAFFLAGVSCYAQPMKITNSRGGIFSVGSRSTFSLFNEGTWENTGMGVGGQFRLQLSDRLNTEWFADYITSAAGAYANRTDYHIGWSVMYYISDPAAMQKWQPYIIAGHCFDNSKLEANNDAGHNAERFSSAVQAGMGTHFNVNERFDISASAQYMIHLGSDLHASHEHDHAAFEKEDGVSLEGHILLTISLNYKIADLW